MEMEKIEKNKKWMARFHRFFTSFISSAVPTRDLRLETAKDAVVYTDHEKVHLGLGAVKAASETEFISVCMFFLGHECQHVLSTVQKTWKSSLEKGFILLAEELEKKSGRGTSIKTIKSQDKAEEVFEKAGISPQLVKKFLHFVLNSIEDGRIERIRQERHPGFKKYRILFRGREWKENPLKEAEDMDERKRMIVLLNQIHSICTTGLFQNGFLEAYDEGTDTYKLVTDVIPDAWEMVQMNECRKAYMDKYLYIVKKLADPLLEGCKTTGFEKALSDAISKMMEQSGQSERAPEGCTGKEEGGTGSGNEEKNIFGGSGASAVIKKRKEASGGSSSTSDEGDSKDGEDGSEGSKGSPDPKEGKDDSANGNGDLGDGAGSSGKGSSDSGKGDGEDGSRNGDGDLGDGTNSSMSSMTEGRKKISETPKLSEGNNSHGGTDYERDIEKSMEEAALAAKGAAEVARSASKATASPAKNSGAPKENMTKEEISEKMNDYDVEFVERTRVYNVSDPLPDEIRARAIKCRRDTDLLFQNKKKRKRRGLMKGGVDSSRLAKAAMNETSFFFKKDTSDGAKSTCAFFLMDNSGSMGYGQGSKRYAASSALAVMEEGFKEHVPLKIAAFDASGYRHVDHELIKDWKERMDRNCSWNFCVKGRDGCGNRDGSSIRAAVMELSKRPEKRKILVVLSDGLPSNYAGGFKEGVSDILDIVQKARKQGILVVSVYFSDYEDARAEALFREAYGEKDCIVCQPDEVERYVIRAMRKFCS